ncbi:hypothetical protein C8J57DRAFT_1236499 [Mycena rebaudengoi]|nr:hypothetical protein C8J57DRAFT_1236499 [Mycena rebaudengoi]
MLAIPRSHKFSLAWTDDREEISTVQALERNSAKRKVDPEINEDASALPVLSGLRSFGTWDLTNLLRTQAKRTEKPEGFGNRRTTERKKAENRTSSSCVGVAVRNRLQVMSATRLSQAVLREMHLFSKYMEGIYIGACAQVLSNPHPHCSAPPIPPTPSQIADVRGHAVPHWPAEHGCRPIHDASARTKRTPASQPPPHKQVRMGRQDPRVPSREGWNLGAARIDQYYTSGWGETYTPADAWSRAYSAIPRVEGLKKRKKREKNPYPSLRPRLHLRRRDAPPRPRPNAKKEKEKKRNANVCAHSSTYPPPKKARTRRPRRPNRAHTLIALIAPHKFGKVHERIKENAPAPPHETAPPHKKGGNNRTINEWKRNWPSLRTMKGKETPKEEERRYKAERQKARTARPAPSLGADRTATARGGPRIDFEGSAPCRIPHLRPAPVRVGILQKDGDSALRKGGRIRDGTKGEEEERDGGRISRRAPNTCSRTPRAKGEKKERKDMHLQTVPPPSEDRALLFAFTVRVGKRREAACVGPLAGREGGQENEGGLGCGVVGCGRRMNEKDIYGTQAEGQSARGYHEKRKDEEECRYSLRTWRVRAECGKLGEIRLSLASIRKMIRNRERRARGPNSRRTHFVREISEHPARSLIEVLWEA